MDYLAFIKVLLPEVLKILMIALLCFCCHRNLIKMKDCLQRIRHVETYDHQTPASAVMEYNTAKQAFIAATAFAWFLVFFGDYLF